MKVVNIRLVVEDEATEASLMETLADNSRSVYAGAALVEDGFGHLVPDMETAKSFVVIKHHDKALTNALEEGRVR